MENARQNVMYLLNEYFYFGCICFSLGFQQYNLTPEVSLAMGYFYIGILGLLLLINVTVITIDVILGIKNYCRQRKHRKRVEEEAKRRSEKSKVGGEQLSASDVGNHEIGSTSKKPCIMSNLPVVEEDSNESSQSSRSSEPSELRIKSPVAKEGTVSVLDSRSNESSASSYESSQVSNSEPSSSSFNSNSSSSEQSSSMVSSS